MKRVWWMMGAVTVAMMVGVPACDGGSSSDCVDKTPASCPATEPSYATDVAPLLEKYCTTCHSANGSQPMDPLDTYTDVKQRSGEVKSQLAGCLMPPEGSTGPTDAEVETILAWVVCGANDN